mmetsp:Transcript_37674/g.59581  ORF Transcript_37674/g.59581 Transcript_37674/m.59581 type:complete len:454 (-) Transcript_37674:134-1495(-)
MDALREQVEYYFSDSNLRKDAFFRDLVASNNGGWVNLDVVLQCPRIRQQSITHVELIEALRGSHMLEVSAAQNDTSQCSVRRLEPFVTNGNGSCNQSWTTPVTKGAGKGGTRKGGVGKGSGKPHSSRGALCYDPATPCGYYIAGSCRHGDKCEKQHSVEYALSIREQWLNPSSTVAKEQLQSVAERICSSDLVLSSALFPRAFAAPLGKDLTKSLMQNEKIKCKRWTHATIGPNTIGAASAGKGPRSIESQEEIENALAGAPQNIRYLLVLDLEGKDEITEFPVIVLDIHEQTEVGRFQRYVRPVRLFDGCSLTPDSPAMPFTQVMQEFDCWLQTTIGQSLQRVGNQLELAAFVTCGDWDCKHVRTQCGISGIAVPNAFHQWVNIKRTYGKVYGAEFRGMKSMLARLNLLDSQGNVKCGFHHLGMHDVENIGRCVLHLVEQGHVIDINGWMRS